MVEATLPTITAVVTTAAVDSINPCAIGVAVLLAALLVKQRKTQDIFRIGTLYVAAIFITHVAVGVGLLHFLTSIPSNVANYVSVFVALLVIGGGLLEFKDFFWYGQGLSLAIPKRYAEKISEMMDNLTVKSGIALGIFVTVVEVPCTGGPYIALLSIISQQGINLTAYMLLILYNLIFVAPLALIIVFVYLGTFEAERLKEWKHMNRARMRLSLGTLMVIVGWLLLLVAMRVIFFG